VILRLLSYNIRFGGRGRERQIAEVVRRAAPDLVVFQEASDPRVIETVATECEMPFRAARAAHSIAFASRAPVEQSQWHYPPGSTHSFLEIQFAGSEARIFGLHLKARFSKWSEARRAREIRALLAGIEKYQHGFHALVGDFNTLGLNEKFNLHQMPGWIRALIWISGRDIKRETMQILHDADYVDGFRKLYPNDVGYTFPVWEPHIRLDYIFLRARHAERLKSVAVLREPAELVKSASDHFPLLIELEID
jgi:exodeoxyribonuclease III